MRKHCNRTPRLARIPVTGLRDQFGVHLHVSLARLAHMPCVDAFDSLAHIFNVVQLAIKDDAKHAHEARLITGGAAALNQVQDRAIQGIRLHDHEIAQIRVGVNAIDGLMGRLDVSKLYLASQELRGGV